MRGGGDEAVRGGADEAVLGGVRAVETEVLPLRLELQACVKALERQREMCDELRALVHDARGDAVAAAEESAHARVGVLQASVDELLGCYDGRTHRMLLRWRTQLDACQRENKQLREQARLSYVAAIDRRNDAVAAVRASAGRPAAKSVAQVTTGALCAVPALRTPRSAPAASVIGPTQQAIPPNSLPLLQSAGDALSTAQMHAFYACTCPSPVLPAAPSSRTR